MKGSYSNESFLFLTRISIYPNEFYMTFIRTMGLNIINEKEYQNYRENMTPILHSFRGKFGYDFKVSEVLASKSTEPINRVFTIEFPSEEVMNDFFKNPKYLEVKKKYFHKAVGDITTISLHEAKD